MYWGPVKLCHQPRRPLSLLLSRTKQLELPFCVPCTTIFICSALMWQKYLICTLISISVSLLWWKLGKTWSFWKLTSWTCKGLQTMVIWINPVHCPYWLRMWGPSMIHEPCVLVGWTIIRLGDQVQNLNALHDMAYNRSCITYYIS